MKKFLALLLALAMIMAFAGCTDNADSTTGANEAPHYLRQGCWSGI